MQTVHINVDENKVDVLLDFIKNIEEDKVESYTTTFTESKNTFYAARKKRLQILREDVKSGKEIMYDFDIATDALIEELQALELLNSFLKI